MSQQEFNFTNEVKGGNVQINQGQNVTATQTNNTPPDPWQKAIDLSENDEQVEQVEAIKGIVEAYSEYEEDLPEEDQTRFSKAFEFFIEHSPKVGRIVLDTALSFPIALPLKTLLGAVQSEYFTESFYEE